MTALQNIIEIPREAGTAILRTKKKLTVSKKSDGSHLTNADMASHTLIIERLAKITHDPIISEESGSTHVPTTSSFWLVDPLDGTRGFITGSNEYSVNIALITNHAPVLAVIYLPELEHAYWATVGGGTYRDDTNIFNSSNRKNLIGVTSRTENNQEVTFLHDRGIKEIRHHGSALKFCMLAEGGVDIYPRFHRCKEWDTAAGHLLAKEAGCDMLDCKTGQEPRYGKPGFINNSFIVFNRESDYIGRGYGDSS